ncbi:MAG TPA: hypothetical protein VF710_04435 [Longimicrobium sp.]|jgi:hypothetical protein
MPTFIRVLLALVLVTQAAPAQPAVEAIVARIRQEVQRIDALRLTAQHTIELEGFSLEGGEARVFLEGGRVARVTATHLGESGRTVETIYFRGGSPIFVFRRSMRYDRLHGRVQSTEEERFYFDRNRMIRWRGADQKLIPRSNPRYAEEEAGHLRFAAQLLSAARSRARTISRGE